MTQHVKLFTPGPGDVDEDVLAALAQPVVRHYGPEWMQIYHELTALLRQIFGTANDIYVVPGPASALLEMAISSLAARGDEMVIGLNGFFGDRLKDIANGYGIQIVPFSAPPGEPLDPRVLETILAEHPTAKVVALVHHETSTTVLNPLRELAAVTRAAGRLLIVDTVSSLGGVPLPVDEWGIDVCVTGANKCLESVPGIGFISISPRAWEQVDAIPGGGQGWYLNLRTWRWYAREWGSWHPSPVTLPTNVILAALESMRRIVSGGLENHYARYTNASRMMREGMRAMGFEMLVPEENAAPIATAFRARPEFTVAELSKWLTEKRSIAISGGLGDLAGKIFRVGHLGKAAGEDYISEFLAAVQDFLREKQL